MVVTNTPEAIRRPVADSVVALVFALAHNLIVKDRLVREGRWAERAGWRGTGLVGATAGIVGLGGIGRETAPRLQALGLRVLAHNRFERADIAAELGVQQRPLSEVLALSDFVIVTLAVDCTSK